MTEQEIVSRVREIMNEKGEEQSLSLLSEDTLKLDDYIKAVIADAVSFVQSNSHVRCVNKKSFSFPEGSTPTTISSIAVPSDFVSLIAVKLSGWKKTCVALYTMESEEYKRQCNQYTKAGNNKPVCVMGYDNGSQALLFFPSSTSLDMLVYEAQYTEGLSLSSNDPLVSAICYKAASLVYTIFENKSTAQSMHDIAVSYIPQ